MDLAQIIERVWEIRFLSDRDNRSAHQKEDDLYYDFVEFIAMSGLEYSALAEEVLSSKKISFPRWSK